jgi:hypothetical protein
MLAGIVLWCAGTALLYLQGLRGTSRRPTHLFEALVTAALTPPLAVYWRLNGALRHRVRFA